MPPQLRRPAAAPKRANGPPVPPRRDPAPEAPESDAEDVADEGEHFDGENPDEQGALLQNSYQIFKSLAFSRQVASHHTRLSSSSTWGEAQMGPARVGCQLCTEVDAAANLHF